MNATPVPPRATLATPATPAVSYPGAMDWFRSTKGFRFMLTEGDLRISGEMARPAIAAERVRFEGSDGEWIGVARATGVRWYQLKNGSWERDTTPPAYADRAFQRLTVAFDPQKKEGEPQHVASENLGGQTCEHFRFTNANTNESHDVWISRKDGTLARVSIARSAEPMTLSISGEIDPATVPDPR